MVKLSCNTAQHTITLTGYLEQCIVRFPNLPQLGETLFYFYSQVRIN